MKRYNRIQFIFIQILLACVLFIYVVGLKYYKLPAKLAFFGLLTYLVLLSVITFYSIVKRLHDIGFSGYWVLAVFGFSVLGILVSDQLSECIDTLIIITFALIPGEKNENEFGPPSYKIWKLF